MPQPTPNSRPGRPIGAAGIRVQAARHAAAAVAALAAVAQDVAAPADSRVRAAEVLLEHARGQQWGNTHG